MEIRELRYFVYVARSGSFNRAASQLNIAQPALSRQLKKLEDELQVQLLVRTARGVELTEPGSILLTQAEALLAQLEQTARLVSAKEGCLSGRLVLGLPPTCGLLIAPRIYEAFNKRWPHAHLVLREGISSSLEEWLLDRRLDIAVTHNTIMLEGIDVEPVLHEHMVLVRARKPGDPPQSENDSVRIKDLANVPLIMPELPHSNRRLVERAAVQHGGRLNILSEVDSVRFTKAIIRRGYGATIQTYGGVAEDVEAGRLTATTIDHPPLMSTVSISMPQEQRAMWLTMEVARLLREIIRDLVTTKVWKGGRMLGEQPDRSLAAEQAHPSFTPGVEPELSDVEV